MDQKTFDELWVSDAIVVDEEERFEVSGKGYDVGFGKYLRLVGTSESLWLCLDREGHLHEITEFGPPAKFRPRPDMDQAEVIMTPRYTIDEAVADFLADQRSRAKNLGPDPSLTNDPTDDPTVAFCDEPERA